MRSTILIISNRINRGLSGLITREWGHLKLFFAETIVDAEYLAAEEEIDMILAVLGRKDQEIVSFVQQTLEKRLAKKVMFFSSHEALHSTLEAFTALPAEHLNTILSSDGDSRDRRVAIQKYSEHKAPSLAIPTIADFEYTGFIGESPEMVKLKLLLAKIAPTGTTILLQGESGTGKEVIARAIHAQSARSNEAFIPVDCAAINDSIIESELFGHSKGAFTGADRNTLGMIRSADKGTLFLDEIAELPLLMQGKLLRTLQERSVKPVGDTKIYPVDIRIIAATNCNLSEAVKKGAFRQDLYYRLNAITIYAPPIREHKADIPLLCDYFINKLIHEGYPAKQFSEIAMSALCAFDWPGNIRELENVVRGAMTISHGEIMGMESLSIDCHASGEEFLETDEPASIASHEKDAIRKALIQTTGNRRAASELLGISEATLYRRLKMYSM